MWFVSTSVQSLYLFNYTVKLAPSEGVLPAYLEADIRLTLRPSQCVLYTSTLSYELLTNKRK